MTLFVLPTWMVAIAWGCFGVIFGAVGMLCVIGCWYWSFARKVRW